MKTKNKLPLFSTIALGCACLLLSPLTYRKFYIAEIPMKMLTAPSGVCVDTSLPGTSASLLLDLQPLQSSLALDVYKKTPLDEVDNWKTVLFESVGIQAQMGNYRRKQFFSIRQKEATIALLPKDCSDGVISGDYFGSGNELQEGGKRRPARLTLDFKRSVLSIDSRPFRPPLEAEVQGEFFPLEDDGDILCIPLRVENSEPVSFMLDLRSAETIVPYNQLPAKLTRGKWARSFPVSVTLSNENHTHNVAAYAARDYPNMARLGLNFLSRYRVTIDLEEKKVCLSPP